MEIEEEGFKEFKVQVRSFSGITNFRVDHIVRDLAKLKVKRLLEDARIFRLETWPLLEQEVACKLLRIRVL